MEYNSTKEVLVMSEYGRHVQDMINHAKTIEDNEYRQAFVERIVDLMMQIAPQNKNLDDYRDKLWKHVYKIARYDLDVLPPSGEKPSPEAAAHIGLPPSYPVSEPRFRHYGHNVQELIRKALTIEDDEMRNEFAEVIGSYMKLAYKTWNKEHYVSDEVIINDLMKLSNNQLQISPNARLDGLAKSSRRKPRKEKDDKNKRTTGGRKRYRRKN